jgi:hypothetical protein
MGGAALGRPTTVEVQPSSGDAAAAGPVSATMPEGGPRFPFFANPASRKKNAFGGLDCTQIGV